MMVRRAVTCGSPTCQGESEDEAIGGLEVPTLVPFTWDEEDDEAVEAE